MYFWHTVEYWCSVLTLKTHCELFNLRLVEQVSVCVKSKASINSCFVRRSRCLGASDESCKYVGAH
jgi:hypothetical protein